MTTTKSSGHVVLVEWDGGAPPTRWYSSLKSFGLRVRGSKDVGPIERRARDAGVIFQEGAIVCKEESTARLLAGLAYRMGAKAVSVGQMVVDEYRMSAADAATMQRITGQWGKRGPKSADDAGMYTITCREEAETHVVDLREQPVVCPQCGGTHINWRRGDKRRAQPMPNGVDVFDYWYATRTPDAAFEIPAIDPDAAPTQLPTSVQMDDAIRAAEKVSRTLTPGNPEEALRMLDIVYCLAQETTDVRLNNRVVVLSEYYAGQGRTNYQLAPGKNFDMVDIAGVDRHYMKYL